MADLPSWLVAAEQTPVADQGFQAATFEQAASG